MSNPRAIVVEPGAPGGVAIREVAPPQPAPSEAIVRVAAISLNRGEVRGLGARATGERPGWDFAGVVAQAAGDGSGPAAGTRVVGMLDAGAWGELIAAPTNRIAALPDAVAFAQAATLPIAGLTALLALERGGSLLGRRVLVTGASGGVGDFAIQLARLGGAHVVGLVRTPAYADAVRALGAHEVVAGEDATPAAPYGPYDIILESVGGQTLATALPLLAPDGACVLFGVSSGAATTLDVAPFFRKGGATLYGFFIFHEVKTVPASAGLARLASLVASGKLQPHVAIEAPWTQIADIARQLMDRRFVGKAVLHVA
ncbi:MAG TPA: zinc-binding dehydrogenase [Ktedonobacterales bacterium]|nr:zinc-binding dehydrogenase [Ktedonobacterales bacterium]